MTANGTAAYGMYARGVALPEVVCALNRAGFENQDICMILSPAHPDAELVREPGLFHDKASDRAISAKTIDWFSKLGAVAIPTVGLFIRSQNFLQALIDQPSSSRLSRGTQLLLGLGFSHQDAKRLAHQLYDFGALVYVSCRESAKADSVIELLRDAGAREAASLGVFRPSAMAA
jgi:hypothetical protein